MSSAQKEYDLLAVQHMVNTIQRLNYASEVELRPAMDLLATAYDTTGAMTAADQQAILSQVVTMLSAFEPTTS